MKKITKLLSIVLVLATVFSLCAASAYADGTQGYINRDGVNMRTGPGTNYAVRACYDLGTVCYITSELSSGWCQVTINGISGYVYGKYVSKGTQAATTTGLNIAGYINSDNVAVRAGSSFSARLIMTVNRNTSITIMTEEASGWCGITVNGQRGYVYGSYVSKGYPSGGSSGGSSVVPSTGTGTQGYINRDGVNMRSGAGTNYGVIGNYSLGTVCSILQELNSGWCQVQINGYTGYVYGKYVSKGTQSSTTTGLNIPGYINANGVNMRSGAGTTASVIGCYNKGQYLTLVTEENSGWCGVIINGQRGYVWGAYVSKY